MKFLLSLLCMALLSFLACLYLPWWSIAPVCFLVAALVPQKPFIGFLTGFTALFFLWGILSYWMSVQNEHILAKRVSMIILKQENPVMLILISALIGALVAGFAAMTGSFLRSTTPKQKSIQ